MKAWAIRPKTAGSARVIDIPEPKPRGSEVEVEILEVGICGTDSEINQGLYGDAPAGEEFLILGHEALGRLKDGSLVVPMVRRPCGRCPQCQEGCQDMCETGDFVERGIKGIHGSVCETIVDDPRWLIPVPASARPYAVLLEPMSVIAKGLRHALMIQLRLQWKPRRCLVLGAGPIGLLATLTLRLLGYEVTTAARKPGDSQKARIAESVGARYHSVAQTPLADLKGAYDFIFEATGSAEAAFDSMRLLAPNGVLCLTSVTGGNAVKPIPVDKLNCELVLGNKLIFGTVNANRIDFTDGLGYLERIDKAFPGKLAELITGRVTFADADRAFEVQREGIKTVFQVRPA